MFYTPVRLQWMHPTHDPQCPWCYVHLGTYLHMFWDCPSVAKFRLEVYELINLRMQLTLLGFHEDEQPSHHTDLLILYLLYYAKKEILLKWTSSTPHVVPLWEAMVDAAQPMYKLTYINRGCPWKYESLGSLDLELRCLWLSLSLVLPPVLISPSYLPPSYLP